MRSRQMEVSVSISNSKFSLSECVYVKKTGWFLTMIQYNAILNTIIYNNIHNGSSD